MGGIFAIETILSNDHYYVRLFSVFELHPLYIILANGTRLPRTDVFANLNYARPATGGRGDFFGNPNTHQVRSAIYVKTRGITRRAYPESAIWSDLVEFPALSAIAQFHIPTATLCVV